MKTYKTKQSPTKNNNHQPKNPQTLKKP